MAKKYQLIIRVTALCLIQIFGFAALWYFAEWLELSPVIRYQSACFVAIMYALRYFECRIALRRIANGAENPEELAHNVLESRS